MRKVIRCGVFASLLWTVPGALGPAALPALCATPVQSAPGMRHMTMKQARNVQLIVTDNRVLHVLTVRLGPLDLPAHAGMNVAQSPDLSWAVPYDAWFTGYLARLEDGSGTRIYARILHHVAVYDTARPNFLCPNQPEHIFGAGGELTEWPSTPGLGYRVHRGDNILISTMFHNDGAVAFPQVYLKLSIGYQPVVQGGTQLRDVYPAWFDVMGCGSSAYDLKPGRNLKTGQFKLAFSGRLIGAGGHLHDYGEELILSDRTGGRQLVDLKSQLDANGRLISIPIQRFASQGGLPLAKGDVITVTSIYDNRSGKYLRQGAMGIVVGYFLPDNPADFVAMRRTPAAHAAAARHQARHGATGASHSD